MPRKKKGTVQAARDFLLKSGNLLNTKGFSFSNFKKQNQSLEIIQHALILGSQLYVVS
jgi:hypothetical protein